MKKLALCSAALLLGALAPSAHAAPPAGAPAPTPDAAAPAAPTVAPKAGDVVYDNTGQQVGSVESVNGNTVVVATEQGKGSMPLTEFAMGDKGLMMNHTKTELETAIRNAKGPDAPAPKAPGTNGDMTESPQAPHS